MLCRCVLSCTPHPAATQRCTPHFPHRAAGLIAGTDPSAIVEHGQFCREPEQCQVGWAGWSPSMPVHVHSSARAGSSLHADASWSSIIVAECVWSAHSTHAHTAPTCSRFRSMLAAGWRWLGMPRTWPHPCWAWAAAWRLRTRASWAGPLVRRCERTQLMDRRWVAQVQQMHLCQTSLVSALMHAQLCPNCCRIPAVQASTASRQMRCRPTRRCVCRRPERCRQPRCR